MTPSPSAEAAADRHAGAVEGTLVEVDGTRYFRVSNYDQMPPLFMTMVSDCDHWLFISTTGGPRRAGARPTAPSSPTTRTTGSTTQAKRRGARRSCAADALTGFCDLALSHIDHSIRVNRRADGLYHSYNVMRIVDDGVELRHLQEMLEGQVAALSSGVLATDEAIALLDALRASSTEPTRQATSSIPTATSRGSSTRTTSRARRSSGRRCCARYSRRATPPSSRDTWTARCTSMPRSATRDS